MVNILCQECFENTVEVADRVPYKSGMFVVFRCGNCGNMYANLHRPTTRGWLEEDKAKEWSKHLKKQLQQSLRDWSAFQEWRKQT